MRCRALIGNFRCCLLNRVSGVVDIFKTDSILEIAIKEALQLPLSLSVVICQYFTVGQFLIQSAYRGYLQFVLDKRVGWTINQSLGKENPRERSHKPKPAISDIALPEVILNGAIFRISGHVVLRKRLRSPQIERSGISGRDIDLLYIDITSVSCPHPSNKTRVQVRERRFEIEWILISSQLCEKSERHRVIGCVGDTLF